MPEKVVSLERAGEDHSPEAAPEAGSSRRDFLTTSELQAEVLPLSRRALYALRMQQIIPYIVVGGNKILYHRASVISALCRRQQGNGGAE